MADTVIVQRPYDRVSEIEGFGVIEKGIRKLLGRRHVIFLYRFLFVCLQEGDVRIAYKVLAAVFDEHLAYSLVIDNLRQRQFVVAEIYQHHLVIGIGQKTAQRVRKRVSYYKKIVLSFTGGVLRYVSQSYLRVVAVEKDRIFIQLFKPVSVEDAVVFRSGLVYGVYLVFGVPELYGIRLSQPEP